MRSLLPFVLDTHGVQIALQEDMQIVIRFVEVGFVGVTVQQQRIDGLPADRLEIDGVFHAVHDHVLIVVDFDEISFVVEGYGIFHRR